MWVSVGLTGKKLYQVRTRFSSLLQKWQNDPRVKVLHL